MLRGSAIRATALDKRGYVTNPVRTAASISVSSIEVMENVSESGNEVLKNPQGEGRVHLVKTALPLWYSVDIRFLRVDPGLFSLVSGVNPVQDAFGNITGFDSAPKTPATSFALEVWSSVKTEPSPKMGFGAGPFGSMPFGDSVGDDPLPCGTREWGYTLFPLLKGGRLSGFDFKNGLVSFSLIGAKTMRNPKWGTGPHDLGELNTRLPDPVGSRVSWRNTLTLAQPPEQTNGIVEFIDPLV